MRAAWWLKKNEYGLFYSFKSSWTCYLSLGLLLLHFGGFGG